MKNIEVSSSVNRTKTRRGLSVGVTHRVALPQLDSWALAAQRWGAQAQPYLRPAALVVAGTLAAAITPAPVAVAAAAATGLGWLLSTQPGAAVGWPGIALAGSVAGAAIAASNLALPCIGFGLSLAAADAILPRMANNGTLAGLKAAMAADKVGAMFKAALPAKLGAWLGCDEPSSSPLPQLAGQPNKASEARGLWAFGRRLMAWLMVTVVRIQQRAQSYLAKAQPESANLQPAAAAGSDALAPQAPSLAAGALPGSLPLSPCAG